MRLLYAINAVLVMVIALTGANPYMVAEPNPYSVVADKATINVTFKRAVASDAFLVWLGEVPYLDVPNETAETVTISGPWHNGRHTTYETLSSPTVEQIKAALEKARQAWKEEVAGSVMGKSWPPPSARHDDDGLEAGPLPEGFDIAGMKRYKRASMTQEIAVTNDRDRISPVQRLALHARDQRWLVSGGLLGFDFRSDLYRRMC